MAASRENRVADNQEKSAGYPMLTEILTRAVAYGADAIVMEYDSGHSLEVAFMRGNMGGGIMLNREAASELLESLWEEKRKGHGKFRIILDGTDYMVQVKTYDHFGENAYRLTFRKAKR
jgi:hypothetical protein